VLLFLLVCALHGVLGWYLVATSRLRTLNPQAGGLQLVMIAPTPVAVPIAKPPIRPPTVSRTAPQRVVAPSPEAESSPPSTAITPPVDWNAEQSLAGRAASGIDAQHPLRDFGVPARPPTTADYPQFDWDYARTHRVESIPQGGVIIHLNDNCVLVLSPLPLALCSPFKHEANGELFKHMRDPDKPGDARLP
jgi:hypothetical protein